MMKKTIIITVNDETQNQDIAMRIIDSIEKETLSDGESNYEVEMVVSSPQCTFVDITCC